MITRRQLGLGAIGAAFGTVLFETQREAAAIGNAPPMPANINTFNALWEANPDGFVAGDMGFSARGTDGSYIFVFGDSAVLNGANPGFVHSVGMRWSTLGLKRVPTSNPDGSFLPRPQARSSDPSQSQMYWAASTVVVGSKLYVFADRVTYTGTGDLFAFTTHGRDVVAYNWPGGDPTLDHVGTTPSSDRPTDPSGTNGYQIMWGASAHVFGSFVYIYGSYGEKDWFTSNRLYLARVPLAQVDTPQAWTFWNGTAYVPDEAAAVLVVDEHAGSEATLSVQIVNGVWTLVSKGDGIWGNYVRRWTGPNPYGPWTTQNIYYAPWQSPTDPNGNQYAGLGHYDVAALLDGTRIFSHSRNHSGGTLNDMITHPEWYRAKFFAL